MSFGIFSRGKSGLDQFDPFRGAAGLSVVRESRFCLDGGLKFGSFTMDTNDSFVSNRSQLSIPWDRCIRLECQGG